MQTQISNVTISPIWGSNLVMFNMSQFDGEVEEASAALSRRLSAANIKTSKLSVMHIKSVNVFEVHIHAESNDVTQLRNTIQTLFDEQDIDPRNGEFKRINTDWPTWRG